jgi:WD40 repeat protein
VWVGQEVGPILVYSAKLPFKLCASLTWHVGGVSCLRAASDGRPIVWSGSNDFTIAKWHTNGQKVLKC